MLISTKGILSYGPGIQASLKLDREIGRYYSRLIPKYKGAKPQAYDTHLTVVRLTVEIPDMVAWGKYSGETIEVQYDNTFREDGLYLWFDAYSDRVGDIREELGLPRFRVGFNSYHITIANKKGAIS